MAFAAAPAAAGVRTRAAGAARRAASAAPQRGGRPARGRRNRAGRGPQGKYRRILIAEFIVCVMLLGLSPLAVGRHEVGPVRFMKRGSATCALFVILGLISSGGRGAAKAAAAFGGLVTLVLLIDQRSAFGKLASILNASDDDEARKSSLGPDESTDSDEGDVAEV